MVINNPYIERVQAHPHILSDTSEIYKNKENWSEYFGNPNNIYLEIGTGLGNFFSKEVQKNPSHNYVGMEIRYKRLFITAEKSLGNINNYASNNIQYKGILSKLENQEKSSPFIKGNTPQEGENIKVQPNFVLLKDLGEHLIDIFGEGELDGSYIFFPDPWAKKERQRKHRLLQETFLNNLHRSTKNGGKAIIKTDHLEYFEFILEEVEKTQWNILKTSRDYEAEEEFQNSETTEFQQLFRGKDIKINYLELQK